MSWGQVVIAALQAIATIIAWIQSRKAFKEGEDAAVARAGLKVIEATEEGKRLRRIVANLSDQEAESLWKRMLRSDPPK